MARNQSVVVIGAGLAGLAAAYELKNKGFTPTILEAAPKAGGRVIQQSVGSFQIDLGANYFLETYQTAKKLADGLGVPLKRTLHPVHSGIYRSGGFHGIYGGNHLSSVYKTVRTMLSFQLLSPKGIWQIFKLTKMLRARQHALSLGDHSQIAELDTDQTATQFLTSEVGTESFDWLFAPGLRGYAFTCPDQIGAAFAQAILWHNGLNGVAWPCMPDGGISVFVDAMVKVSEQLIRLSTPVQRVVLDNGIVKGVITQDGYIEADAVVCATTATEAIKIAPDLPNSVAEILRTVNYSKVCRVFFGVKRSPFPKNWYAVAIPHQIQSLIAGMSDLTVLTPECAPREAALIDAIVIDEHAQFVFELSDDEVQQRVLSEVRRFFPAMSNSPLAVHVHRWPEAICLAPPGTMKALHNLRQDNFGGLSGLFLAGDYLGVPSMEAALLSGLNAARGVIEYLDKARAVCS